MTRFGDSSSFQIWHANIDDLKVGSPQWDTALSRLTGTERKKVTSYLFDDDKKRALYSILLQHSLVKYCLRMKEGDFSIIRTPENKPFACSPKKPKHNKDWNYNVSHHGRYVCIASHAHFLVGADIVDLRTRSVHIKSSNQYLEIFEKHLHRTEIEMIKSQGSEEERYNSFFAIWALKESFIKAIGLGLGFDLQEIRFIVHMDHEARQRSGRISGSAVAFIHGIRREDWRFDFFSLDDSHLMALALGPLSDASESYRKAAWGADIPGSSTATTSATASASNNTSSSTGWVGSLSRSLFGGSSEEKGGEQQLPEDTPGEVVSIAATTTTTPHRIYRTAPRLDEPLPPLLSKTLEELLAGEQADVAAENDSAATNHETRYHTPTKRRGRKGSADDGDHGTNKERMCVAL